ncbi:MAG: helix-turn-helix transcriptional regulator [Chloroflexota bacterium]|nr:helix-turn-helix transcriptional regulator [Chloroflexota bacterium]MDE2885106.1 helix-turn-helix transcriptional regulator [Chloroflexota bacterium]
MAGRRSLRKVKVNPYAAWRRMDLLHLSQNELARLTGLTSGYVSLLLSGKRCPSPEKRRLLQEALGVAEFDDLFIVVNLDE